MAKTRNGNGNGNGKAHGGGGSSKAQADRARIARAFSARCTGIPINLCDVDRIFAFGGELIAQGVDDVALGDGLAGFVGKIRTA